MRLALSLLLLLLPIVVWGQGDPVLQTELRKLAWQDGPTEGL